MPKKYLLYIHDERFSNEKEKSKLVNDLLAKHYESGLVGEIWAMPTDTKFERVEGMFITPSTTPKDIAQMKPASTNYGTKDFKFCKHDAVLGMCKKGCK